jgi:tRNA (guanine-N7-)-methyltransferase
MVEALREFADMVTIFGDDFTGKGCWNERFPKPGPLLVELGTGKGQFLREMAQKYPDVCFIGLEKEPGVLLQAVRKTHEMGLRNLQFILGDVGFLTQMFASGEVDGLYIHFCDPWPKERHAKRRLTHEGLLALYKTVLSPDGIVRFKTDNRDLFEYSLETFQTAGMKILAVCRDVHSGNMAPQGVLTEYEAKFAAAGMPILYCEAGFGSLIGEVAANE